MNNPGFSRAIVTGAGGLLGRALIARLLGDDIQVLAVDQREPQSGVEGWGLGVGGRGYGRAKEGRTLTLPAPNPTTRFAGTRPTLNAQCVTFYRADVTDVDAWDGSPEQFWQQPEETVLFHLAGIAHAGYCREQPLRGAAVNVTGALAAVEACRRRGVRRVLFPSTALVYGPEARVPAAETDPPCPTSFYAATKLAAEALLQGYASEFGVAIDVVRLGNVYGCGAASDTVHSILLQQAIRGERLSVKTLRPIRDFIYTKDVAEGMVRLAGARTEVSPPPGCPSMKPDGKSGGFRLFNLSSGRPTSIGRLACVIAEAAGSPDAPLQTEPDGPGSLSALVLDIGKLTERLGWRPEWSLEAGMAEVLAQMRRGEP